MMYPTNSADAQMAQSNLNVGRDARVHMTACYGIANAVQTAPIGQGVGGFDSPNDNISDQLEDVIRSMNGSVVAMRESLNRANEHLV